MNEDSETPPVTPTPTLWHTLTVEEVMRRMGYREVPEEHLRIYARWAVAEHYDIVRDYLAGKERAINALVGKVLARKRWANARRVRELILESIRAWFYVPGQPDPESPDVQKRKDPKS